jgi:hypothetical protein
MTACLSILTLAGYMAVTLVFLFGLVLVAATYKGVTKPNEDDARP